jgi:hypothetical protein
MKTGLPGDRFGGWAAHVVVVLSCIVLSSGAVIGRESDDDEGDDVGKIPLTVSKAVCGLEDHPEIALQGQVPASLRASGFPGFNCNLKLVGQSKGDGANWQSAEFKDRKGHTCGYHGTAFTTASRTHVGAPVVDLTDPDHPTPTGYLTSISMLDPWESLKVNERRELLGADNGHNGAGGPEVDIYDLSGDCREPQLLASVAVGTGTDGGDVAAVIGHEGSWAPDGLTYYGGSPVQHIYYAVDMTDPTAPNLITTWLTPYGESNIIARTYTDGGSHGLSISEDGNRGYMVSIGGLSGNASLAALTDAAAVPINGLLIYDLSEIQSRKANPQVKLISSLLWKDGGGAQHTIPIKIRGKPYIIFADELGSGGGTSAAQQQAACAAGLPPFPLARIIDISDETEPKIVSRLGLEVHDPANCSKVQPDLVGLGGFTYGSHYCSVDNKDNATTLACGYFNSGIRIFDIRKPRHVKEIAYFNPAGTTTPSPGSNHAEFQQWRPGGPDWCNAQVHLDAERGTVWTTCQDNGLLMLKFERHVWPFEESRTPPGEQN